MCNSRKIGSYLSCLGRIDCRWFAFQLSRTEEGDMRCSEMNVSVSLANIMIEAGHLVYPFLWCRISRLREGIGKIVGAFIDRF